MALAERISCLNESISEGVKRFEAVDGIAFGFGKGFDCSCDVNFVKDSFEFFTAKFLLKFCDGLFPRLPDVNEIDNDPTTE